MLEQVLPDVFAAYRDLGEVLRREARLEPSWRELVLVGARRVALQAYRAR